MTHLALRAKCGAIVGKAWLRYALLAVAGFIVHLPALTGSLIWDDVYLARDNPFIKSPLLALEVFRHHLFLDSFSAHYRPVQNVSFMVDYYFWNTEVSGFHLTNILLHLIAGLLLYRLLIEVLGHLVPFPDKEKTIARTGAFLVALIWMVHPVHSAAVDYISGRADSLCFAFACGGWVLFLRAKSCEARWGKIALYCASMGSGLLALCSREVGLVWVAVFLLHTLAFGKNTAARQKLFILVGTLAVVAAYAAVRHLPEARFSPPPEKWPLPVRTTMMMRALGDYGRLLVFPSNLHMERTVVEGTHYIDHAHWQAAASTEYLAILGLFVALCLVAGSCLRGPGQAWRIFGAAWFVIGYLPTSNIVQLNATVAEHWLYLPSVGFLIFLAGCVLELPVAWRKMIVVGSAFAVIALGTRSWYRSSDWSDELTFYQRTFASGGVSARVAGNLALAYSRHGNAKEAEKILRRVVETTPDYPIARNNLADLLAREGKLDEAQKMFAESEQHAATARKDYPHTWIAALNLAHLLAHDHQDTEAIAILERARHDYPQVWDLIALESEIVRKSQGPQPALQLINDFLAQNWWHYAANLAAGRLYAQSGDPERALPALRQAARLDVHDTEALNLEARICRDRNRLDEAFRAQERAVARQPDKPSQYLLLSDICERMGRSVEAKVALAEVVKLQSFAREHPETVTN